MKKHIGLKDIAEKTGFSIKTVSRALNDHPDVSEKTREIILSTAKKYSYYPNLLAKSLRTQTAYAIGYIVPDITNEFFGKVGETIEKIFKNHGYSLLISFTEESKENEIDALRLLLAKRVDGIVLATVGNTGDFLRKVMHQYTVPLVVIDNRVEGVKTNLVLHDNIKGAYILTKHLLDHGHENIGCITGPLNETSGKERLEGYKEALKEYGIQPDNSLIRVSNWRIDGGFAAAQELMKGSSQRPSAIFIGNSIMALGVYKALKKMELKVPDDVALVSFDNLEFTEALDPPLTTLDKAEHKIGKLAADLLLDRIRDRNLTKVEQHLIDGKLCIRGSCGCK